MGSDTPAGGVNAPKKEDGNSMAAGDRKRAQGTTDLK